MKILVIEDSPTSMKLAVLILNKAGHETLQACDAESGINIAREHNPDAIIMDIELPGMDGYAATRILKHDAQTKHIPVIALTALAMKGDKEKTLQAGCDSYISKPIDYKECVGLIETLIQKK
jgi:two-component system cell cycle response regulator DivK